MGLPKFFGIDIGNHSIKAIRIEDPGGANRLAGFAYGLTPSGVLFSETDEAKERLAFAIRDIIKSSNLAGIKQVAFAVPESHVVRRLMMLPYVDDNALENAVSFEMKKWLSIPIDDVRIGKVMIGAKMHNDTRVADVLGIAVKISYLDKYIRILEMAGLEPIGAETEAIASVRALSLLTKELTSSYLIVDFGSNSTDVSVAYKNKLIYSDSIPYGSDSITKAISQSFSMDIIKAEEYKRTYGINFNNFNGKLASVISPVVDLIVADIRKTLEYFKREYSEIAPAKLLITGDAANMPGLVNYLAEKLSITAEVANPWKTISVSQRDIGYLKKNASAYSTAIGLARKTDF